jgi:hypothetical protein
MALSVRSGEKLRLIFALNYFTGLKIPDEYICAGKIFIWEVIFMFLSALSMICSVYLEYLKLESFTVTSMGQPIISVLWYWLALAKGLYFVYKKRDLVKLIKTADDILNFKPFLKHQRSVFNRSSRQAKRVCIFLITICFCCYAGTAVCYEIIYKGYRQRQELMISGGNVTRTISESNIDNIFEKLDTYPHVHAVILSNIIFALLMILKNSVLDMIMLFCQFFVVEELNFLHNVLQFDKHASSEEKFISQNSGELRIAEWILMFNKIKRCLCSFYD